MFKIAIVVCLLSAVSAVPAPEADAQFYYNPYQAYQGYNPRGYNQQAGYSQEDAMVSLERKQMEEQLEEMARKLWKQFTDMNLVDKLKQSTSANTKEDINQQLDSNCLIPEAR